MMLSTPADLVVATQRETLERLAAFTAQQEQALDAGDIVLLSRLSDLRTRLVQDAAACLPPYAAWDPTLAGLAAQVQEQSEQLQQSIRSCMAAVRRELVALTDKEHVTQYLSAGRTRRESTWRV